MMQPTAIEKAMQVIAKLRHPSQGCPWDLEQTHESLLPFFIEEVYEYIHAVEIGDVLKMEEELGDVFLQVLLHSQIASESNHFDLNTVAKKLSDKMIRRHPHVFDRPELATNTTMVIQNWEKIKKTERGESKLSISLEDAAMPALMAARKIGKKSRKLNFDWEKVADVMAKVDEELIEVKDELAKIPQESTKIKEELGDLLFSVAQLCRHLDVDPEQALREANLKFIKRINHVEKAVKTQGKEMQDFSTPELEKLWSKAKDQLSE